MQLLLDLFRPAPPTFDSYVIGKNAEPLAALMDFVRAKSAGEKTSNANYDFFHTAPPTPSAVSFYLWGDSGVGKTHLLDAAMIEARQLEADVHLGVAPLSLLPQEKDPPTLWFFDNVDAADEKTQGFIFTLYNRLKAPGIKGGIIATGKVPPMQLAIREDTRTRLGQGAIFEISRLNDDDKPQAILQFARARGLPLSEDIIAYLMKNAPRDMRSLVSLIDTVDCYARAHKRAITLPLVRHLIQENGGEPLGRESSEF
jgi:DnaA family protein